MLPDGRYVWLPGRGRTFVRELAGPPGAPAVMLLHGWSATADLNWFACFEPLARHFRVIALDHRGHGRGLRALTPFRLEHCADDVATLADVLGLGRYLAVGYSMGGPIAQLLWKRHPELVSGLVLCATSTHFSANLRERLVFGAASGTSAVAGLVPLRSITGAAWTAWCRWHNLRATSVVGLRRGRPPRLAADRRGRPRDRPLRLPAVDRRRADPHGRCSPPRTTRSSRSERQLSLADGDPRGDPPPRRRRALGVHRRPGGVRSRARRRLPRDRRAAAESPADSGETTAA